MNGFELKPFEKYQDRIQENVPLSRWSRVLCGGPAAGLISAESSAVLEDLLKICTENGIRCRVLGNLSNILFSDSGYDGLIILNRTKSVIRQGNEITSDSGNILLKFVRRCSEEGLCGIEWAAGIPGTIGGAVYGNAGAFGSEIKDVVKNVRIFDPEKGEYTLTRDEMAFAYRSSILKRHERNGIILSVQFSLIDGNPEICCRKMNETIARRGQIHPEGMGSLGSVFKNPEGTHAGKLIEDCGLKGTKIGTAEISEKHGNFFVTRPGAKSSDYLELIRLARKKVKEQTGIELEPEIEMIDSKGEIITNL